MSPDCGPEYVYTRSATLKRRGWSRPRNPRRVAALCRGRLVQREVRDGEAGGGFSLESCVQEGQTAQLVYWYFMLWSAQTINIRKAVEIFCMDLLWNTFVSWPKILQNDESL